MIQNNWFRRLLSAPRQCVGKMKSSVFHTNYCLLLFWGFLFVFGLLLLGKMWMDHGFRGQAVSPSLNPCSIIYLSVCDLGQVTVLLCVCVP